MKVRLLARDKRVYNVLRGVAIVAGCALYALSFNLFLSPYDIVPGGVSGISMIINRLTGWPSVGVMALIINIPLFIVGLFILGKKFIVGTLLGTIASSVLIDVFAFVPAVETEPILAALYGGLCNGAGLGVVFFFGGTTGGVDIVASLIKNRRSTAKMGQIILIMDGIVVLCAAIVFRSLSSAMYAIVVFYVSSIVTDSILYGGQNARIAYIISEKREEISQAIIKELSRGVTFLHATGAYTGKDREVILCAVKKRQVAELKRIVHHEDENAFLILSSANEVLGEGFSYETERGGKVDGDIHTEKEP